MKYIPLSALKKYKGISDKHIIVKDVLDELEKQAVEVDLKSIIQQYEEYQHHPVTDEAIEYFLENVLKV